VQHAVKNHAMLTLAQARANKMKLSFVVMRAGAPNSSAAAYSKTSIWLACELHRLGPVLPDLGSGRSFPAILTDEVVGEAAAKCLPKVRRC
jgi:hypothetical protein